VKGIVLIHAKPGTSPAIVNAVRDLEGTTSCFAVFGRSDVVAFANVRDFTALNHFALECARVEGVTATETLPQVEVA